MPTFKLKAATTVGSFPPLSNSRIAETSMTHRKLICLFLVITAAFLSGCNFGKNSANSGNWQTISVDGTNKPVDRVNEKGSVASSNSSRDLETPADDVSQKLLHEYGAVLKAQGGSVAPPSIIFKDAAAVSSWQSGVEIKKENVGGVEIELQAPAMKALLEAVTEAKQNSLPITPRGADAARRSYEDTEKLWASRVEPGLDHWVNAGKLSKEDAGRINSLPPFDQVTEIFKLESQGMYFSKDLSKSIIYSVAPPGSSQHLTMLALDVQEYDNSRVREILARHGWFQTVVSDLPHFTYLGVSENELPGLGLKKISQNNRAFWLPKLVV
jgi:D-alanyl-D-alanine carboxypeptidase